MALENKLGITSSAELAREEERISKKKAVWLFESGRLSALSVGTFAALKEIHKSLFEDIYEFAGSLRSVNLAKGNFRFAPVMYLEAAIANIEKMPQSTYDEIIEKSEKAREEARVLYVAMTRSIRSFSWIEIQGKQNLSWQNLIETEV